MAVISTPALICASRPHAETGVIVRLLTPEHGLIAAYVAGGRGRDLRPVLIPGNAVMTEISIRNAQQMPSARLELVQSRGPWLSEPLPAAAIGWIMALTASALPERHAYPSLYPALSALLDAVCYAPSARGWVPGLLAYEALVLGVLGYERDYVGQTFDQMGRALSRYILAEKGHAVMAARRALRDRLARMENG